MHTKYTNKKKKKKKKKKRKKSQMPLETHDNICNTYACFWFLVKTKIV